MAAYAPAGQPANIINHFVFVVDESYSMKHLKDTTIRVFDGFITRLAAKSRAKEQETRVTVYFFNSYGTERCVIYDMDVLRVPSLAGMYRPDGNTALLRTFLLAIRDLRELPQKYGDHSFAVFGFTDGQENDSARPRTPAMQSRVIAELHQAILTAPDNETYGLFVPDQEGVHDAKSFGFPAGNISIWNPNSAEGIEEVGRLLDDVTEGYMEGRKRGVRGYSASSSARGGGLFRMADFSPSDVRTSLTPVAPGSFFYLDVTQGHRDPGSDGARLDHFYESETDKPYPKGRCYYEFTKAEKVQGYKQVAVEVGGVLYSGTLDETRALLGLPMDHEVKLRPDQKAGATIFIQSTSNNRKLLPGTRLLVMR
jgi:hypothetical protein